MDQESGQPHEAACIRRVVAEARASRESLGNYLKYHLGEPTDEERASRQASIAINIGWALKDLLPDRFSDEIGDDLCDAIEYWGASQGRAAKAQDQLRRRRIVSQARLDIGPVSS